MKGGRPTRGINPFKLVTFKKREVLSEGETTKSYLSVSQVVGPSKKLTVTPNGSKRKTGNVYTLIA